MTPTREQLEGHRLNLLVFKSILTQLDELAGRFNKDPFMTAPNYEELTKEIEFLRGAYKWQLYTDAKAELEEEKRLR